MPAIGLSLKRAHKFCLFALTVLLAACGDGDGMNAVGGHPVMHACLRTQTPTVAPAPAPGATVVVQANEPGTLRQNLRDLRVADATVQLEKLAGEVAS